MVELRTVTLHEGPFDGHSSIVSHATSIHAGELYVWDGDVDLNHFVHGKALLGRFTPSEKGEWKIVNEWLDDIYQRLEGSPAPASPLPSAPPVRSWLINLAVACRQYGINYETGPEDERPNQA